MAKRVFQSVNWTATATADALTHTNAQYQALKGGSTTQRIDLLEVEISGFAAASAPLFLQVARTGALGTTPTALAAPNSDGPTDPATAALAAPPVTYIAAATGPTRSNATTDARLNVGLNAFGGILRWNAAPTQQWVILGNALGAGETVLSAYTGTTAGAVSSHLIYEPY